MAEWSCLFWRQIIELNPCWLVSLFLFRQRTAALKISFITSLTKAYFKTKVCGQIFYLVFKKIVIIFLQLIPNVCIEFKLILHEYGVEYVEDVLLGRPHLYLISIRRNEQFVFK